jgi:hypothetical protein
MPIERFNSTITMRVPFSVDQLITLGITPEHLLPTYWDEATFSWKPIPNFSLEVYDDGNGYLNLSINHFTDFAMLNSLPTVNIYIPSILH